MKVGICGPLFYNLFMVFFFISIASPIFFYNYLIMHNATWY